MHKQQEYKKHESSSSDEEEWESEEMDEEFDPQEYQKLLLELFPSKFLKNKVNASELPKSKSNGKESSSKTKSKDTIKKTTDRNGGKKKDDKKEKTKKETKAKKEALIKLKKKRDEDSDADSDSESDVDSDMDSIPDLISDEEEKITKSTAKKKKVKSKKKKEEEENESGSEEDTDTEDDTSDDDDEDYDEDDLDELLSGNNNKLNIIFTLGGTPGLEESESDEETEEEEEEEDSDCESEEEDQEEEDKNTEHLKKKVKNEGVCNTKDENNTNTQEAVMCDSEVFDKFNKMISELPQGDKENKAMKSIIKEIKSLEKKHKKEEEKKSKKLRGKNTEKFRKLLRDKNVMNDTKFFETKLSVEQQRIVLEQIEEVRKHSDIEKPYRLAVLDADIPLHFKSIAYKKINTLKYMEPGDSEYYKIKNWVDTFMQIPFGKYKTLPLTLSDGVEASHDFMTNAKDVLDKAVFGLNDAKLQVMQMIGQWIANPNAVGTAIAIKGPMGTGKTTLVKDGISKILGRDFAFIALGGATDSSFLEGHSYTYEGSTWGKIVDILVKCKCMNPIIYFDELDKVSDTPKGEEITGILTHLTDTTQNNKFHDKYFSELHFDLSRCLFIFSYNDESKVNPILRDRMYRIQTKGYDAKEKTIIAKDYIVPSIREQVKFDVEDVTIPNDVINHIIDKYTDKEDGVRNLKRCLEIIHTKLNLYRLMKPGTNLFEKDMKIEVTFPVTVTKEMVDKLIKQDQDTGSWQNMYM
jgi:ATP-dependent Lon protease